MRNKIILTLTILTLIGCKSSQKLTYSKTDYDSTVVSKVTEQVASSYTKTEEHVYDSVKIDYRIGKIDTVYNVRVDTFVRDRYIYKQAKALAQDSNSKAVSNQESQTKATEEKTAKETVKSSFSWRNMLCYFPWLIIAILVICHFTKSLVSKFSC